MSAPTSLSNSSSTNLVMHDSFPRVGNCKPAADSFFSCLNENSKKLDPLDKDAGIRGLQACLSQKKAYDGCMDGYLWKNSPQKLFRVRGKLRHHFLFQLKIFFIVSKLIIKVQEEYRLRQGTEKSVDGNKTA